MLIMALVAAVNGFSRNDFQASSSVVKGRRWPPYPGSFWRTRTARLLWEEQSFTCDCAPRSWWQVHDIFLNIGIYIFFFFFESLLLLRCMKATSWHLSTLGLNGFSSLTWHRFAKPTPTITATYKTGKQVTRARDKPGRCCLSVRPVVQAFQWLCNKSQPSNHQCVWRKRCCTGLSSVMTWVQGLSLAEMVTTGDASDPATFLRYCFHKTTCFWKISSCAYMSHPHLFLFRLAEEEKKPIRVHHVFYCD